MKHETKGFKMKVNEMTFQHIDDEVFAHLSDSLCFLERCYDL
jgi:hypothetical protein